MPLSWGGSRGARRPAKRATGYESDASTSGSAGSSCSSGSSASAPSSRPLSRCGSSQSFSSSSRPLVSVRLHVYNVGNTFLTRWHNTLTKGYGMYHTAVEVYGQEWGYGKFGRDDQSGVFTSEPKMDPCHSYRETIDMGDIHLSFEQWDVVIEKLVKEWRSGDYHLLNQNCNHFSQAVLRELQVGPLPEWCNHLAQQPGAVSGAMSSWLGDTSTDFDAGKGVADFYTDVLDWLSGDPPNARQVGPEPQSSGARQADQDYQSSAWI